MGSPKAPPPAVNVALAFDRAEDLLARLYPNGGLGGLEVDGPPPGPLGVEVRLTLRVKQPAPRHFNVRTRLAWVRRKASRGLRQSHGVDFVPEDDAARRRLVAFARGDAPAAAQRAEERLGIALAVTLHHATAARKEQLADLSVGGAFLRTHSPLPAGTAVEVSFRPPRALRRLRLRAQVAWRRTTGQEPGMGLRFEFDDPRQAKRVASLVARLESGRRAPAA